MSDLVHNEQVKLLANFLNTIAGAVVIGGVVAPLVALTFVLPTAPAASPSILALLSCSWLVAGCGIHYIARAVLRRLRP